MEKIGEFFSEYGELLLCGLPVLVGSIWFYLSIA